MSEKEPVIIVGCPRSGTYLLCSILQSSFDIAIPVETQFIPLFQKFIFLVGNLKKRKNRQIVVNAIFDFLKIWTRIASKGRSFEREKGISLLLVEQHINEIVSNSDSFSSIVSNIFKKYSDIKGCSYWGDKAAFSTPPSLSAYKKALPNMKVIHIVRDGRDVAISWRKIWTGPSRISVLGKSWAKQVGYFRNWCRTQQADNHIEIKYEDLLANNKHTIECIGEFLNHNPKASGPDKRGQEFAQILSCGNTHEKLANGILENNQSKWIDEMEKADLRRFELIARKELIESGYRCFAEPNSVLGKDRFFIWVDVIIEFLRPIHLLYKFKYLLPLGLLVYHFFKEKYCSLKG